MASIKEKKRDGKVVSFRFIVFLGRDENGKQILKTKTWHPPSDLTLTKARTAAKREADQWEAILKGEAEEVLTTVPLPPAEITPARSDDFVSFVNDVWFPLAIEGSERKPKTVSAYKSYLKIEDAYFRGKAVQEIPGPAGKLISCFLQVFYVAFLFPWLAVRFEKKHVKPDPQGRSSTLNPRISFMKKQASEFPRSLVFMLF